MGEKRQDAWMKYLNLDLNINGEKTTKYLDEISKLGFKNIILATGEKIENDMLPKGISRITGKLPPL